MKTRIIVVGLIALFLAPLLAVPALAQDDSTGESALLRLLRFVPDTPDYRDWLYYGDIAAWHASWDIPRLHSMAELDALDRVSRAYWLYIMPRQTTPPPTLGLEYLTREGGAMRDFLGFNFSDVDRAIMAGQPPDTLTVAEFDFDAARIGETLRASGYEGESLDGAGTLYSRGEDYELSMDHPLQGGMLGDFNRVALVEGQVLIAKATSVVTAGWQASNGEVDSLADDAGYAAAASALQNPAFDALGDLVGVIVVGGSRLWGMSPTLLDALGPDLFEMSSDEIQATLEASIAERETRSPLPFYSVAAFATHHNAEAGASFLTVVLVFPPGVDAAAAADTLAGRMQDYVSTVTNEPLDDRWSFETAMDLEAEGLPVAAVVMRVDDPPPTPDDAELVNAAVFSWAELIARRDILFIGVQ